MRQLLLRAYCEQASSSNVAHYGMSIVIVIIKVKYKKLP